MKDCQRWWTANGFLLISSRRNLESWRKKPNVLFIITDQQRADHVGFMGHPSLRTPHPDALAAQGWVFLQCVGEKAQSRVHAQSAVPS